MKILIKNISQIVSCNTNLGYFPLGADFEPVIKGDSILIEDGKIKKTGSLTDSSGVDKVYDACGGIAVPGFADCHTHLVFHGTREDEAEMRTAGLSYKDIAAKGGGIKKSVAMTRGVDEGTLYEESKKRLTEMVKRGVTSIEIKSGYGLDSVTELKQLRVIRKLKENFEINIKATYLGAHEFPDEYRDNRKGYIKFITDQMIPLIAKEELADYVDVFCEKSVYTAAETEIIIESAYKNGLESRIHADEIEFSEGSTVAKKMKVKSVDHFNIPNINDLNGLKENNTVITLLPATNFLLRIDKKPPIEEMRKIGNIVAVSTDFNPGSSPVYSILSSALIGMINYRLMPRELIYAITLNPAYSLGLSNRTGSLKEGNDADILIFEQNNYKQLFYFMGADFPKYVFVKGKEYNFG